VKETALMFAPLLLVYLILYRERLALGQVLSPRSRPALRRALLAAAPALLLSAGLLAFSRAMVPATLDPGGPARWRYLLTQPFVLFHYFCNFVLPVNLAIESDWTAFTSPFDERVYAGVAFVVLLLVAAAAASRHAAGRTIAYGILWFFIAAAPTSSIFPLAEVVNHHRPFFPYVGLTLAASALASVALARSEERLLRSAGLRAGVGAGVVLLLVAHAIGVHRRNEMWSDRERLWAEAARKGPSSGRILMNYATELMVRGDYTRALEYFERARAVAPGYSYVRINLGVLTDAMGDPRGAEVHFRDALTIDPGNPEAYSYFASFLRRQGREDEALELARRGLALSPSHADLNDLIAAAASPESLLTLSLNHYQAGRFEESVAAARRAAALRPDWDRAWNNVCAAQNRLGRFEEAIEAGERAVELNPDNELARNNLAEARRQRDLAGGAAQSAPSTR
jgi:tetratricopeptide (TPR) repeat protein